jgi:competence protein ComEC
MNLNNLVLTAAAAILSVLPVTTTGALEWSENDLYIRIVDVGPGLCAVAIIPGGHVMVYDAGHWVGSHCVDAVTELIADGGKIDLMVISHSDGDHLGNASEILEAVDVEALLHTGDVRSSGNFQEMVAAIAAEGDIEINLEESEVIPGDFYVYGDAKVSFVAGWHEWTETSLEEAESRNAISIVIRLEFAGKAVLFTGDTIGRRRADPNNACKDAERLMVDNASAISIEADVMTAPHHGGNNGSANCFIAAVDPTFVIFSAGHEHRHPTQGAADRYVAYGVSPDNIFRTDRGDDETGGSGGSKHWVYGAIAGCIDERGDDDIEIVITAAGDLAIDYRKADEGC